jgi:membrane dipeptidase
MQSAPVNFLSRRGFLTASVAALAFRPGEVRAQADDAARRVLAGALTIDMHSHAGRFIRADTTFEPVAAPMREGGLAVAVLAIVADSPTHKLFPDRRFHPFRDPQPGELYGWSKAAFARLLDLARQQQLRIVSSAADLRAAASAGPAADLRAAASAGPAVVVASEGADFLEGHVERIDEARTQFGLRHLQLTHYRPNDLGDIQTEDPVHGGLTDFGVEVVRACNRLGVVVDVAHGTYDLVKRAAAATSRPLILSHTSLSPQPGAHSRQISPDHARVIAQTGGVVGVWPPTGIFSTFDAMAEGMARMIDAVGVDHVGLGTDMDGLPNGTLFANSYRDLPRLVQALLARGLAADDIRKILGGNYARVFAATVG